MHGTTRPIVLRSLRTLAVLTLLLAAPPLQAQQIQGVLSNFDVHNVNDEEMTNLELDLRNINPSWVINWYRGPNAWGNDPIIRDISGTEITWADFRNPVQPGEMRHFGLEVDALAPVPCGVQAYWTRHLKIVELPLPWQVWEPMPGTVMDIIQLAPEFPELVMIQREFAVAPIWLPLEELNWDNTSAQLDWQLIDSDPVPLPPGGRIDFPIPFPGGEAGLYMRYTVALASNPENVLVRVINEAEVIGPPDRPEIFGSLSNFDVHNDTGKPVHDLELELEGVTPQDVYQWYTGPDAWGLGPDGAPAIDFLPDGSGTQLHWVDEWKPLDYCQWRHFGVRLNPWAWPLRVSLHWTRVVKDRQIPVPWQWWQTPSWNVITDVIQLSDTFDRPVLIQREWAVVREPVPLDALNWDLQLEWLPDPQGEVWLRPGDQTFLEIPVDPRVDGAVLVRYTVNGELRAQPVPEVRFVNEALLAPVDPTYEKRQPAIMGSLSNFDVINLGDVPYTNLELDIRNVQPEHILGWYQGANAWGLHPDGSGPAIRALPQTEVMWADFWNPLPYCETRHFGIELVGDATPPCGVQAYWTQHGKVVEIPVPWQWWEPGQGGVIDVIQLSPEFRAPVWVVREFAVLDRRIPLDELNWDNPGIPWIEVPSDPMPLFPGEALPLDIQTPPGARAALVRYQIFGPGSDPFEAPPAVRFVNEAELETDTKQGPAIVGSLSNFDVTNLTGKPVHDLELDLYGLSPEHVWDWYRGPNAWGIDPRIGWTADGTGADVTWIDDRNPMLPGETRHFGLRLDPRAPWGDVRAFWTRPVKVRQIPVPWQFWLVPGRGIVRDVVQLSDTFTEPVEIIRDFAVVSEPVPLDDLNWNLAAFWQPDPAGLILLAPGFQADLDIAVDPSTDAAVLVRYTVFQPSTGSIVTRFVNEAVLGPGTTSGLVFRTGKDTMWWNRSPLSSAVYDVVRGDLSMLPMFGGSGGIHDASCIANDVPDPWYTDLTTPMPGVGWYYLVRADGPTEHGTYDTTTDPTKREGRDGEINPATDCP